MTKEKVNMEDLLAEQEQAFKTLTVGDSIDGEVVSISKSGIWIDLGPHGAGLVVGPEVRDKSITGEKLKPGDVISASVLETESDEGYAILSMRKASRDKIWDNLSKLAKDGTIISVKPFDANKGGLLMEYEGIRGFLPVSQLSTENYPRVSDKDEIQIRLSGLIGKPMDVVVLDADEKEGKLIFSEKEARKGEVSQVIDRFEIGHKVKGVVTGVVDFGIFVNVEGVEGLIHISEISWDRVEDPSKIVKVGDAIEAVIIGIENDRFSLSLKRLTEDPWAKAAKEFKVGDIVEGEVTRVTPYGSFVRIHDKIEALVHISELAEGHIKDPNEIVEVAKRYKFQILSIDVENHKIALSLKAVKEKKAKRDTATEKKEEKAEEKAEKVTDKASANKEKKEDKNGQNE
jgi:small subunit ribosomal protein S1